MDSSSLIRWRKRLSDEGVETLLMVSINAALKIGTMKASSVDRVILDTTVMPQAIAHPNDGRLLRKSRQYLVKLAQDNYTVLYQNYNSEALRFATQVGRYFYVKQ